MRLKSWFSIITSGLFLTAPLMFFLCPVSLAQVEVGQTAPGFTLLNLKEEKVSLENYKGKIVVLDFWATWCLPCRQTLPELAEAEKKYRDKGVVFLGLSIDAPDSYDNQYVAEFKDRYKIEYQILRADADVVTAYLGTEHPRIPVLIVIDRNGIIIKKHVGFEQGIVESTLLPLLSPD